MAVRRLQDSYDLLGKTVVLAVGRLVERKGFDTLIDSVPLVNRVLPNVVYYLAGTGPDEQYLRDKVKALPSALQKKVTFLGKISEEEKWRWLDACTMLAMPARAIGDDIEGFGIVYLEANLAGKPVIAGRSGGVEDAVQDNINGLVVEPTSHQQLAEAIIRLASYQGLAQRLGDQGRQRARQEFAWSKQANKIYDIIKS
ncbi:MAG: Glycosyltransferase, group 1 family protein [Candidatus Falkowbacteria bacterium GW2011_GWA2_39_24]|uniref:Glycosyltransferase, group 1 family protein n=1 Tax=Candidatus Falkowbacteria bacterium GW2011_GWA2_39_24 TaxID=1618634 RepID=A0A0G0NHY4_9BACT|nr:MAG: Glycosyltransferase, group 1 family protein [Candidatus Falkowbacteria bacterium GW2011_GWA2_39_24]